MLCRDKVFFTLTGPLLSGRFFCCKITSSSQKLFPKRSPHKQKFEKISPQKTTSQATYFPNLSKYPTLKNQTETSTTTRPNLQAPTNSLQPSLIDPGIAPPSLPQDAHYRVAMFLHPPRPLRLAARSS